MKPAFLLAPLLALAACSQPDAPETGEAGPAATSPAASAPTASASADAAVESPSQPASPLQAAGGSPARTDGYGSLRLGMTADEARAAWPGGLKGDAVEPDNCAYLRPEADTDFRVGFMFERGLLVRYDVAVADVIAPGGGRVGQTRADIERLYRGRVQVQPHEYVPGGRYLRVTDPAIAGGALVFETDEAGRVTRWRVGRAPQVDYVEGCA